MRSTPRNFISLTPGRYCAGKAVASLWPHILEKLLEINFAYTSFKWANLASYNAGVTVVIVGVTGKNGLRKRLFLTTTNNSFETRDVKYINAYLVSGPEIYVEPRSENLSALHLMAFGNMPIEGGLSFTKDELQSCNLTGLVQERFIRKIYGAAEYIRGLNRYCLWIYDVDADSAMNEPAIRDRLAKVEKFRSKSKRPARVLA